MELKKKDIEKAFAESKDQFEIWGKLYRLIYPNWDKIKSIKGFPQASPKVNDLIFSKFIEFDSKHHKDVLPGGLWMDKGFSTDKTLKGWIVKPAKFFS